MAENEEATDKTKTNFKLETKDDLVNVLSSLKTGVDEIQKRLIEMEENKRQDEQSLKKDKAKEEAPKEDEAKATDDTQNNNKAGDAQKEPDKTKIDEVSKLLFS